MSKPPLELDPRRAATKEAHGLTLVALIEARLALAEPEGQEKDARGTRA